MSEADGETHELFVKALEKEEEGKKKQSGVNKWSRWRRDLRGALEMGTSQWKVNNRDIINTALA